jgi:hypothetical protein
VRCFLTKDHDAKKGIALSSDHEKPYKRYDHGTCTSTGALGRRDPALRTLVTLDPEEASPLKG